MDEFKLYENLSDDDSALMSTINQIKNVDSSSHANVFWNDQPVTENASAIYAHGKGMIGVKDG